MRRDYRLVRRRVVDALKARLREYRALLVTTAAGMLTYRFEAGDLGRLQAVLSSYLGHFKRAKAYRLWQTLWLRHDWLVAYFKWDAACYRLRPRWQIPTGFTKVRQQCAWVRGRFPQDALLFQVGTCYEFYDRRDASIAAMLGLQPLGENRRGALFGVHGRQRTG